MGVWFALPPFSFRKPPMPFKTGPPLEVNLWCLLYILITIGIGIWRLIVGGINPGGGIDQKPYAGHHYQRRQTRDIFPQK
jgi:hypothetical protein